MKTNDFTCPRCKGHLNAGGYIIFSAINNKKKKGLILLSPDVGSYTYQHHDNYAFQPGEMIDFYCPICQTDLKSKKNPKFVSINMADDLNMDYEVLFSRKAGEKSTYIVSNDDIQMFGEDAADIDDLFEY